MKMKILKLNLSMVLKWFYLLILIPFLIKRWVFWLRLTFSMILTFQTGSTWPPDDLAQWWWSRWWYWSTWWSFPMLIWCTSSKHFDPEIEELLPPAPCRSDNTGRPTIRLVEQANLTKHHSCAECVRDAFPSHTYYQSSTLETNKSLCHIQNA